MFCYVPSGLKVTSSQTAQNIYCQIQYKQNKLQELIVKEVKVKHDSLPSANRASSLLQALTSELVSQVRRGSRQSWPVTSPSPSFASFSASCWSMVAGPTSACAASSATSSTRTLPSPWCTSGSASSVVSLPRSENKVHTVSKPTVSNHESVNVCSTMYLLSPPDCLWPTLHHTLQHCLHLPPCAGHGDFRPGMSEIFMFTGGLRIQNGNCCTRNYCFSTDSEESVSANRNKDHTEFFIVLYDGLAKPILWAIMKVKKFQVVIMEQGFLYKCIRRVCSNVTMKCRR